MFIQHEMNVYDMLMCYPMFYVLVRFVLPAFHGRIASVPGRKSWDETSAWTLEWDLI